MKNYIFSLSCIFLLVIFVSSCNSDDDTELDQACELTTEQENFYKIDIDMNYDDVSALLGEGNLYLSSTDYAAYQWTYCGFVELNIIVEFTEGKITGKGKSFKNESCSNGINEENFSLIATGDTYLDVVELLDDTGDRFGAEYQYSPNTIIKEFVAWYDCDNAENIIQVAFENGAAVEVTKTF